MRAIDTHFHWFPESLAGHLLGSAGYPRSERAGDGYRIHYNDGKLTTSLSAVWLDLERGLDDSAAAAATAGADVSVICTTGVMTGILDQLPAGQAVPAARDYNEQVAKVQQERPGTFYGTALIPLHDTDTALAMLDEAVRELGLLGVNLPALTSDGPVDNPRLEDFYGRAQELGVPLILHPGDMAFGEMLADYGNGLQLTIGRVLDTSITVLRLIFSGILQRHPDLKVVQTHGGGLLPYQAGRIDKNTRVPGLSVRPGEYLKKMYVDTVCPAELTVETAVRFYGDRHVMYGTDYPCWHPSAAIKVLQNADLTAQQRELILHSNAESVFSLPG
jgi:aminocarboxymuconate-semialdehyde decarboxylase